MKKVVLIISILFITFSCTNKREKLNGHWHEYYPNDIEYTNCYKITDTSFVENNYIDTIASLFNYKTKTLLIDYSEWNMKDNNRFILPDSMILVRQPNNLKTYISDFSSGLLVDIHPYETNNSNFDFINDNNYENPIIHIGKLKENYYKLNLVNDTNEYQIQLNDKIAGNKDLRSFLYFSRYDGKNKYSEIKILIQADKKTPKELLDKIESEITIDLPFEKSQIYYLTINLEKRLSGFNRRKE